MVADGVECSGDANINWPAEGDWLRYTVQATEGLYDLTLHAATEAKILLKDPAARMLVSEGACADATPILDCPAEADAPVGVQVLEALFTEVGTEMWQFGPIEMGQVALAQGNNCFQLCFLAEKFQSDYFELALLVEETTAPTTMEEPVEEEPVEEEPVEELVPVPVDPKNPSPVVKKSEKPDAAAEQGTTGDSSSSDDQTKTIIIATAASVAGAAVLLAAGLFVRSKKRAGKGAAAQGTTEDA
jgi:hypothetical protein